MNFEKLIPQMRLRAQQLVDSSCVTAADVLNQLGAIQSQDLPMSKWAVALRTGRLTEDDVDAALNEGSIIRTHILRPTWHLVAAGNLRWMLELTGASILRIAKSFNKQQGISDAELSRTFRLFEKWFAEHSELSRKQLSEFLLKSKIDCSEHRLSHFLFNAELNGLICSGTIHGNVQHYALLDRRIPPATEKISREEAIGRLATMYFKSHGPATVDDFSWWSGLARKDSATGAAIASKTLSSYRHNELDYYFDESHSVKRATSSVHLLPSFDEVIISYRDRSAVIPPGLSDRLITRNGIFYPAVIDRGIACGSWKRLISGKSATVTIQAFNPLPGAIMSRIEKEVKRYSRFIGRNVILSFEE